MSVIYILHTNYLRLEIQELDMLRNSPDYMSMEIRLLSEKGLTSLLVLYLQGPITFIFTLTFLRFMLNERE